MRKISLVVLVCLVASAAFSGGPNYEPLNVKLGLWQVTEKTTAQGMPIAAQNGMHSITYKTCVTKEKLAENPFSDHKCKWTVLRSSASDEEAKGTNCDAGENQGMDTTVHYKLHAVDPEHVNGSGEWTSTGGGMSLSGTVSGSGHWVAASCGNVR